MELLIVIAILAVLAAIAIPTFTGTVTKAKKAAARPSAGTA
jgi:Tfp pilus assembly protein PilE